MKGETEERENVIGILMRVKRKKQTGCRCGNGITARTSHRNGAALAVWAAAAAAPFLRLMRTPPVTLVWRGHDVHDFFQKVRVLPVSY